MELAELLFTAVMAVSQLFGEFFDFLGPNVRPRERRELLRSGFRDVDEIIRPDPELGRDGAVGASRIEIRARVRIRKLEPDELRRSEIL